MDDKLKGPVDPFDPKWLRPRLIKSGLFLLGHEVLVEIIREKPRSFFAHTWTSAKGFKPSPEYTSEVLELDPKGKNDPLRGGIAWLRIMSAIDSEDEIALRDLTDIRNQIAHEMQSILDGAVPIDLDTHFSKLVCLVEKIEKWWCINVELAIQSDVVDCAIDPDGVIPGSILMMQMLKEAALGKLEA